MCILLKFWKAKQEQFHMKKMFCFGACIFYLACRKYAYVANYELSPCMCICVERSQTVAKYHFAGNVHLLLLKTILQEVFIYCCS